MRNIASQAGLGRIVSTLWCRLFLSCTSVSRLLSTEGLSVVQFCSVNKPWKCQVAAARKKKRPQQLAASLSLQLKGKVPLGGQPLAMLLSSFFLPGHKAVKLWTSVIPSQPRANISSKLSHWDDTFLLIPSGFPTRTPAGQPKARGLCWATSHCGCTSWGCLTKGKRRMWGLRVWWTSPCCT